MLSYSRKNVLLQAAVDVAKGKKAKCSLENEEEKEYFDRSVQEVKDDLAAGYHFTYSVGDYDDD